MEEDIPSNSLLYLFLFNGNAFYCEISKDVLMGQLHKDLKDASGFREWMG